MKAVHRISLDLPTEVKEKLKINCAFKGKNMADVLRKLVLDYLKRQESYDQKKYAKHRAIEH